MFPEYRKDFATNGREPCLTIWTRNAGARQSKFPVFVGTNQTAAPLKFVEGGETLSGKRSNSRIMRRTALKSTQTRFSRLAVSLFGPSRTLVLKRTMSHRLLARARVAGRLGGRCSCGFRTTSPKRLGITSWTEHSWVKQIKPQTSLHQSWSTNLRSTWRNWHTRAPQPSRTS